MSIQKQLSIRMDLYSYFKPTSRIPDPRGSLSSDITPEAIHVSLANKEVDRILKKSSVSKKRVVYTKYIGEKGI